MPLSLKAMGSAGYRDQRNKTFACVQVNRIGKRQRTLNAGALLRPVPNVELFMGRTKLGILSSQKGSTSDPVCVKWRSLIGWTLH